MRPSYLPFAAAALAASFGSPILAAPAPVKTAVAALPATSGWTYNIDGDELESTWVFTAKLSTSAGAETRIVFDRKDEKNYQLLRIVGGSGNSSLRFWSVKNGVISKLGDPDCALPGSVGELALQRSAWRARVLWNGHTLLTASLDGSKSEGATFGTATRGKAQLSQPRMQPTEAIVFRDDFMRAQAPDAPEVEGQWHRVSGTWKTSGLLGPRADADLNPNPFVYRAEAQSTKIIPEATVGKWFWSDYVVEAAVRPTVHQVGSPLIGGIAAYRQSNGVSVTGEIDFNKGVARLRQGRRILAESKPFTVEVDQWHRLFLDPGPGVMRLVVDGIERVRYESLGHNEDGGDLAQGEATLLAQVGGGNFVDFDDVRIAPGDAFSDEFTTPSVGRWTDALGEWQTRAASGIQKTPARRVKLVNGPALSLAGVGTHDEGRIEASFVASKKSEAGFGVVFAARDKENYYLAKVLRDAVQIIEVANGKARVLGASPKGLPAGPRRAAMEVVIAKLREDMPGAPAAAAVSSDTDNTIEVEWRDGAISARSGSATATANVNTIPDGRAGVWADGPAGSWAVTDFRMLGIASSFGEGRLPERFTKDGLMQNWATNASLWHKDDKNDKETIWWHTGDFFNDATISLPLPALTEGQKFTIMAGASPESRSSGSRLNVQRAGDQIVFDIGREVKSVSLPLADAKGELRFAHRPIGNGSFAVRAALGGRTLFAETVTPGLTIVSYQRARKVPARIATKVGIRTEGGLALDWDKTIAHSSNVIDYSFTGAPTDWRAARGLWNVSERWTCSPQWGFFAGQQSVNPTLWSRFALRGDWTMEAYLASPMDITRGERSPMDLNVTVDGDGRDLASGYSFLFGSDGRRTNRIFRGDEVVDEKAFQMPQSKGSTHQDWFYVRLERRQTNEGLRFRYSVNGQEIWNYLDARPLEAALKDANHLAFWTYNGGLSIARVRLWYTSLENGEAATRTLLANNATSKPEPITGGPKNNFSEWKPRRESLLQTVATVRPVTEQKQPALEITNNLSGGDWTVNVSKTPFDAKERPTLKFRYRAPQGVLVNLYAFIDGKWREIGFTGNNLDLPRRAKDVKPAADTGIAPMGWGANLYAGTNIGQIEGVQADDKWHTASFNLLEALQKAKLPTHVEALALAAPDRDYLRAGLGGNRLGATYRISDFDVPLDPKARLANFSN